MSVVGYDFGSESCIVAVAASGGIETVDNDYSQRATPSYVAFGDKQRMLGVSAKLQTVTNIKNTIHGFKRLIGRQFNDPVVQAEIPRVPFKIVPGPNGVTGVKVEYLSNTCVFTVEQITAMLFTKLKETAEHFLKMKSQDCVISVPSYFTTAQRQALMDSAAMAGLNVLQLFNESTATALSYGIYKQDLPKEDAPPRIVVFVDCGHSALQVFACAFNMGKLKMLACSSDPLLGGRDFDEVLANYFSDDFSARFGVNPKSNAKAYVRLVTEVEKLKKQMSANSTVLPINIESLMDKDVSGAMCRADFENLAAPLLERVETTLQKFLVDSKLSKTEIHSVEIVGGSSRIPAIKALIEKTFGFVPSTTLNQDEAVGRGCALQCAILSPTYKVRDFNITDVQPYAIKVREDEAPLPKQDLPLFPRYHTFPYAKMLTFYRNRGFTFSAYYPGEIPYPDPLIATFEIKNLGEYVGDENLKIKVKLKLNMNGLLEICEATAFMKSDEPEEVLEEPMDTSNGSEQASDLTCSPNGEEKNDATSDEDSKGRKKSGEGPKKSAKVTQKFREVAVPFGARSHALPQAELMVFVEQEGRMIADDRMEKERIDAKNALEEYVYHMRDMLEADLIDYIKDNDRENYLQQLKVQEEWLYEDGAEEMKNVYAQRLEELKKTGEPIKNRKREFEEIPVALEHLSVSLSRVRKIIDALKNNDPAYDHLDKSECDKLVAETQEASEWFEKSWGLFQGANKKDNSPVAVRDIYQRAECFQKATNPIITKSKPKVELPKENNSTSKSASSTKSKNGQDSGANKVPEGVNMETENEVD